MTFTPYSKKELSVSFVDSVDAIEEDKVSTLLDGSTKHCINEICWDSLINKPNVSFAICYNRDAIFLKFYVVESTHQATYNHFNDPVFKDSCVEFFLALDDSGGYYNFEFNSLGTALVSYGKSRYSRTRFNEEIIKTIKCLPAWKSYKPNECFYSWELTVVLLPALFYFDKIDGFYQCRYKGNFYKCGDDLPEPHYLSWSPIASPVRDFHQSAYFGLLNFT
jgi:hypothetical protein